MKLEDVKNVGPKLLNDLNKLGIHTIEDLIDYYPFRYEIIKRTPLIDDEKVIIDGIVSKTATVMYLKMRKDKMSFQLETDDNVVNITIFNRGYLKTKLIVGIPITIIGKYSRKTNTIVATDIRFKLLSNETLYEPIYHVTSSINSVKINNLVNTVDKSFLKDIIPDYLLSKYKFVNKKTCVKYIHNPTSMKEVQLATNKIKYEELFLFMLKMNYLKKQKQSKSLSRQVDYKLIEEIILNLPFKLTEDQIKSINDIYADLLSGKRMNRLLQGDVGAGKTIVSFIALYINYLAGYQGALMAPTEILAKQHFDNFKKLFPNIEVVLLTGKTKTKTKIYEEIKNKYKIIIGTHALISEKLEYNNLGLVITDEQHRFGVNQRSVFKNKGITPDILYMSATPIPRTYAITLFGDMDVSTIKTKPAGRKEIISMVKKNVDIKEVLKLMYTQIKLNHQVYVIAPLIEESENIELENVIKLQDKMNSAFGKICKVDIMHGKLSNKEKEEVMTKFKNNETQILISTTVIEVGVDVANATCMVVFDGYRFGLSALHQLRGRIGRNDLQSYFVVISDVDAKRLEVLTKTNDGFLVSEYDFKLRGSGEFFGVKQSGDMEFKLADLKKDYNILLNAKKDSEDLLNSDFTKYPVICEILNTLGNLS